MSTIYTDIIRAREKALERGLDVVEVRLKAETVEEMKENMVSVEDVSDAVGSIDGPSVSVIESSEVEELVAKAEGEREVTFEL